MNNPFYMVRLITTRPGGIHAAGRIVSAGVIVRMRDLTRPLDFWFRGVWDDTANTISVRVGSSDHGRIPVTWPTSMPPNSTDAPGARRQHSAGGFRVFTPYLAARRG